MDSISKVLSQRKEKNSLFVHNYTRLLTVAEWKVLLALAYHGSLTRYDIKRQYNVTYTTIDRVMRGTFERIGWVTLVGMARSSKGTPAKLYGLTQEGILWLLTKFPSGMVFSFDPADLADEMTIRAGPVDVGDVVYSAGTVSELKMAKKNDDIIRHVTLFERFSLRIAKCNQSLFPIVFGGWDKLDGVAHAHFSWIICRIAFQVLLEKNKIYGGLVQRFGTVDKTFAYLLYKEYLRSASEQSGDFDSQFPDRILKGIERSLDANPELRELCTMICKDLEAAASRNLSFVKQLQNELTRQKSERE